MANTKKNKTGEVDVKLGRLAEGMCKDRIQAGTTVKEYLASKEINYTSSIKVNGKSVKEDYVLQANDLVTSSTAVEGGV